MDEDDIRANLFDPSEKLEELKVRLNKILYKKKTLLQTKLRLNNKQNIGVKVYNLLRKTTVASAVNLNKENNSQMKRRIKQLKLNNKEINAENLGKCLLAGKERIPL